MGVNNTAWIRRRGQSCDSTQRANHQSVVYPSSTVLSFITWRKEGWRLTVREMIRETRVAPMTQDELLQKSWVRLRLSMEGAISYGVDLAVLSLCNHTVMDYGSFGAWAGLLAGGRIILPTGYSVRARPDMLWWSTAKLENAEFIDVSTYTG